MSLDKPKVSIVECTVFVDLFARIQQQYLTLVDGQSRSKARHASQQNSVVSKVRSILYYQDSLPRFEPRSIMKQLSPEFIFLPTARCSNIDRNCN